MTESKPTAFLSGLASEGLTILANKILESSENLKSIDHTHNINISQAIILSSALFGSIYMGSVSLIGFNKMFIRANEMKNKINYPFVILNGNILFVSSIIRLSCASKAYPMICKKS
jgi:uncharacterized membrane protein (DUF485 family)